MKDSQLLKGILEGCVLSIIARGETYGYELMAELERCGFENILEGTLYPVLTRLESRGMVSCRRAKSPCGPTRKYYSITVDGKRYLKEFKETYSRVTTAAEKVLHSTSDLGEERARAE